MGSLCKDDSIDILNTGQSGIVTDQFDSWCVVGNGRLRAMILFSLPVIDLGLDVAETAILGKVKKMCDTFQIYLPTQTDMLTKKSSPPPPTQTPFECH